MGSQYPVSNYDYWSDTDYWRFEALAGDKVAIAVNTPASGLDPYLELRDANDSTVASENNGGPDSDDYLSYYTIPADGTYYVRVGDYYYNTTPGSYEVRVELARGIQLESDREYANDSVAGADPLTLEPSGTQRIGTVAGTIMAASGGNVDEDYFSLGTISGGETILAQLTLPESSTLKPIIEIRDANNQIRSINPNPADGSYARMDVEQTGTYYAVIVAFDGQGPLGQYLLDVTIAPTAEFQFADLSVTQMIVPTTAATGMTIPIEWAVGNFGTAVTSTDTWYDRVVLSRNTVYGDADDIPIVSAKLHVGALEAPVETSPGEYTFDTYTSVVNVQLPLGEQGDFWILIKTDAAADVFEFSLEANNVRRSDEMIHIDVTPYGDLRQNGVTVSADRSVSGESFTIDWNVTNAGPGTTGDGTPGGTVERVDRPRRPVEGRRIRQCR